MLVWDPAGSEFFKDNMTLEQIHESFKNGVRVGVKAGFYGGLKYGVPIGMIVMGLVWWIVENIF
jgi:tetrahydromethanopterin S-methyltransferase subunit B